jgi:FHA domain
MGSEPSGQGDSSSVGLDAELDRAVPSSDAGAFLVGVGGNQSGRVFVLAYNTVFLGRAPDADVHVPDPSVSARHARIINGSQGFEIEDLESTNGTFVGGQRITRVRLANGDRVTLGKVDFTFLLDRKVESTVALIGPNGRWPEPGTRALARVPLAAPPPRYLPPGVAPGMIEDDGPSLSELIQRAVRVYRFLRAHSAVIGIVGGLGLALGLASLVVSPPPAEAICVVKLQPQVKSNPIDPQQPRPFGEEDDSGVQFFAGAEQAFKKPELVASTLRKMEGAEPDKARTASVAHGLRFEPLPGPDHTYRATFRGRSPAPVPFLTAHLRNYLEFEITKALRVFTAEADFLRDQLKSVEKEMDRISGERIQYREKNSDRLPEEASLTQGSRFALETKRADLVTQVRRLQADLESERRQLATGGPLAQSKFQASQVYRTSLADVNRKLSEAYAHGLAEGHPDVIHLNDEKRRIEGLIQAEMHSQPSELDRESNAGLQTIQAHVIALQAQLGAARSDLADTEQKLGQIRHVVGDLPRVEERVKQLTHTQEETTLLHAQLFERLKKAELHLNLERVSAESRYEIVTAPHVDPEGRIKAAGLRSGLGLLIGLVVAAIIVAVKEGRKMVTQAIATMEGPESRSLP